MSRQLPVWTFAYCSMFLVLVGQELPSAWTLLPWGLFVGAFAGSVAKWSSVKGASEMSEGNDEASVIGRWRKHGPIWACADHGTTTWNLMPLLSLNVGKNAWAVAFGWLRWSWWVGRPYKGRVPAKGGPPNGSTDDDTGEFVRFSPEGKERIAKALAKGGGPK